MAYRRRHGPQRSLTFIEDTRPSASGDGEPTALHRDGSSAHHSKHLTRSATYAAPKDITAYEYASMKNLNEAKYGFWGVLARSGKAILEEDSATRQFVEHGGSHLVMPDTLAGIRFNRPNFSPHCYRIPENPSLRTGSEFGSSLHNVSDTIKNALEEGLNIVENRTADIIQETRKLQIRRKSGSFSARSHPADLSSSHYIYPNLNDHETQLKASRDVANAMAAKAKLLLRELKSVKADLSFAKERCSQLEEENKLLRESQDKGDIIEDDDLIRLQLETLLEEKSRLAHDNSIYSRENRFLREIVEYHQLTMQGVLYVNDEIQEADEACRVQLPAHSSHSSPRSNSTKSSLLRCNSNNSSPRTVQCHDDTPELSVAGSDSPSSPSTPTLVPSPLSPLPEVKEEGEKEEESETECAPISPRFDSFMPQASPIAA